MVFVNEPAQGKENSTQKHFSFTNSVRTINILVQIMKGMLSIYQNFNFKYLRQ